MKPIHALIFLFKYVGQGEGDEKSGVEVDPLESGVWFANQACLIWHRWQGDYGAHMIGYQQQLWYSGCSECGMSAKPNHHQQLMGRS